MTSLSTSAEGRVRSKSVMANADATFTLSKVACAVTVLLYVDGHAAAPVAGGWLCLRTRLLCIFTAICCSNEWVCSGSEGRFV